MTGHSDGAVRFKTKSVFLSLPFSKPELLEDIVKRKKHGPIHRVWLCPGHVFISVKEGQQLFTFDTKSVSHLQESEYSGCLDITLDSPLVEVLVYPPNAVLIFQKSGKCQYWRFRQDFTWNLVQTFHIGDKSSAEIVDVTLNISQNSLFWCEQQSDGEKQTFCVCRRQISTDEETPGSISVSPAEVLLHSCPCCNVYPTPAGVFVVVNDEVSSVSLTLVLSTIGDKVTAIIGDQWVQVSDVPSHNAVDFRQVVMRSLHYINKAKCRPLPLRTVFNPTLQCLVQVDQGGQLQVITDFKNNKKSRCTSVQLEDYCAQEVQGLSISHGYVHVCTRQVIRSHCITSGKIIDQILCPDGQSWSGACTLLMGALQPGFYTNSDLYLVQKTQSSSSPSEKILLETGHFLSPAIQLAHLDQVKHRTLGPMEDLINIKEQCLSTSDSQVPDSRLSEMVDPYLTQYWNLDDLLQKGLKDIDAITHPASVTVEQEVESLLNPKTPVPRSARQAQLTILSSSFPERVLNVLISKLDLGTGELSTSQLHRWQCVLTPECSNVSSACDMAIPVFEHICYLLFTHRPTQLMSFVKRGQQVSDQKVGVSAFIRKRQTLQVYERALACIPDPAKSCDSTAAVDAMVELLLTSEVRGSILTALRLLLKYSQWEKSIVLLSKHCDNSRQHFQMYQLILAALRQSDVLHQYSDRVFALTPSWRSVETVMEGEDSEIKSVFCKSESVTVDSIRPHLLKHLNNDS